MNYDLLQEHIDNALCGICVPELKADGENAKDFFIADVVGNRRFAQNYGGYPRSEIAEINEATNLEMQKVLLNQLMDYRSKADSQNAGLTDAEIALGHRSKYQQTPSEMQTWLEDQLAIRDEKVLRARQAAYDAALAEKVKAEKAKQDIIDAIAKGEIKTE